MHIIARKIIIPIRWRFAECVRANAGLESSRSKE